MRCREQLLNADRGPQIRWLLPLIIVCAALIEHDREGKGSKNDQGSKDEIREKGPWAYRGFLVVDDSTPSDRLTVEDGRRLDVLTVCDPYPTGRKNKIKAGGVRSEGGKHENKKPP